MEPETCSLSVDVVVGLYVLAAVASLAQCAFGVVVFVRKVRAFRETRTAPRLVVVLLVLAMIKGALFFATCAVRATQPKSVAFGAPGSLGFSIAVRLALFLEFITHNLFFIAASRILSRTSFIAKSGVWTTRSARAWSRILALPHALVVATLCFAPIAMIESGMRLALAAQVHFSLLVVHSALMCVGMVPFLGLIRTLRAAEKGAAQQPGVAANNNSVYEMRVKLEKSFQSGFFVLIATACALGAFAAPSTRLFLYSSYWDPLVYASFAPHTMFAGLSWLAGDSKTAENNSSIKSRVSASSNSQLLRSSRRDRGARDALAASGGASPVLAP